MSKTISVRLEDEEYELLYKIAKEEHIDPSSLIRKFVLKQMQLFNMEKMSEHYRKGTVSLQEAATQAQVSIYQMMDYLETQKITPPAQTDEEMQEDIERSKRVFAKLSEK